MKSEDADHDIPKRPALELAFELFDFGERVYRQSLCREHPTLDGAQIETLVLRWLKTRPGAEGGDADGRVRRWDEIENANRKGAPEARS